jgi:hypothetical protein
MSEDGDLLAGLAADPTDTQPFSWPTDEDQASGGRLRIDLDDGRTSSGCPVSVEARVTALGLEPVQAVIRVQGLEAPWCPPPQVVSIAPDAATRLYLKLAPTAGTPPGRYLWSLTAEVPDRPMLAVTAELHVERPSPVAPAPRRSRWRTIAKWVAASAVTLLVTLLALTKLSPSRVPWGHEATTRPKPGPTAAGPRHRVPRLRPSPVPSATTAPELVQVHGTVLDGQEKRPTRITAVRLSIEDLTGNDPPKTHRAAPRARAVGTTVHGKHWSLMLPPGLYGLTFSKAGYTSKSIVIATTVAESVPPPHVRLSRIAPASTSTAAS